MFLKKNPILNFASPKLFPIWLLIFYVVCGCSPQEFAYRPNELHAASLSREFADPEIAALALSAQYKVNELFGTPDSPKWPNKIAVAVDLEKVARAAGPVGRNEAKVERGLTENTAYSAMESPAMEWDQPPPCSLPILGTSDAVLSNSSQRPSERSQRTLI